VEGLPRQLLAPRPPHRDIPPPTHLALSVSFSIILCTRRSVYSGDFAQRIFVNSTLLLSFFALFASFFLGAADMLVILTMVTLVDDEHGDAR
jgi:hypothetical protein